MRSTPREDSATSASESVFGSDLILPNQFSEVQDPPSNQFYAELRKSIYLTSNIPETIPAALSTCSMVLVRKDGHVPPLAPLYDGPYRVLSRSPRTFKLQVGPREEVVSVHHLKPDITSDDQAPAQPP